MEIKEALEQLELLQKKLYAFQAADSALFLDSVTVAPRDTAEGRGVAMGILAGERQKLMTDPKVGEMLAFLAGQKDALDQMQRRQVEVLQRNYDQLTRIPAEESLKQIGSG